MRKQFLPLILGTMFLISFLISSCGNNAIFTSQSTGAPQHSAQPQSTIQQSVTQTAPPKDPTVEGIPTPDNWVTITIHMTEGGVRFDPYKLYISAIDVKGILWVNNTDLEITLLNSDIPSKVTPSSLHFAAHESQKLILPKNESGEYLFHINPSDTVMTNGQHCTIIRE